MKHLFKKQLFKNRNAEEMSYGSKHLKIKSLDNSIYKKFCMEYLKHLKNLKDLFLLKKR